MRPIYMMGWKTTVALGALSFFFGMNLLVYFLFYKDENDEHSECDTYELEVPEESVGSVMGRGGTKIWDIEQKSDTNIRLVRSKTKTDNPKFIISGTSDGVHLALLLIQDVINRQRLMETKEMYIPVNACGRLIGKGGENIQMIRRVSNAQLTLARVPAPGSFERKLTIKGTPLDISIAQNLIDQMLKERIE